MATYEEIQRLYDEGKIPEAMAAVWAEVQEERGKDDPDIGRLMMIRAWCHWRRQEWDDARQWLQKAEKAGGAELETNRLQAYFAAYRDKDDFLLRSIAQEFPDDVDVQNALVIRAQDADSTLSRAQVGAALEYFSEQEGTSVANLNHNAARFFLAKSRDPGDLSMAAGMINRALQLYGKDVNWHHRAAALFWKSKIIEKLGDREEALYAAERSLFLWNEALDRDPANEGFRKNRDNAIARIAELQ